MAHFAIFESLCDRRRTASGPNAISDVMPRVTYATSLPPNGVVSPEYLP